MLSNRGNPMTQGLHVKIHPSAYIVIENNIFQKTTIVTYLIIGKNPGKFNGNK